MSSDVVAKQKRRADRAWQNRSGWDQVYNDAYDFALPQRKPGGAGKAKQTALKIFDMTAPASAMHGAGQLQRQVFPPGQEHIMLEAGPLVKNRLPKDQVSALNRGYLKIADQIEPFYQTGAFDSAMHETCIDLFVGTGAIMPVKGPSIEEPLFFVNIPQDELAAEYDCWGRLYFVSWRRCVTREQLIEGWPKGNFSKEFRDAAQNKPDDPIELYQDFTRKPDGSWEFVAYCDKAEDFFVRNVTRSQPIAVARFYKAPGEHMGRGPLLMALPTIKTLNKAQELALKAAAIQMLGIWAYRAGGTFNPNNVKIGAGTFWPMDSTGGILGPDIQRLDPASGRIDIARLVISNAQQMVRDAMLDHRLVDDGGTPASASEVAAKLQQNAQIHIGAYGRMVREIMPVVVPRSIEILNEFRIIDMPLPVNELIYSIGVRSPMMQALKSNKLQAALNYFQLVTSMVGPERAPLFVSMDRLLTFAREGLQVDSSIEPSPAERQKTEQDIAQAAVQQVGAAMAEKAAPNIVDLASQRQAA